MRLERLLQINIVTLAALGTVLLSMGQNDVGLPLIVIMAAVTSFIVTDVNNWFHLNKTVANIAALIAAGVAAMHFRGAFHAIPLLSIARFLIYLQVILLFQRKDARLYWQLCALSFLQVVVAAAFNQGVVFGILLGGYLFIGISTLALFYLYREDQTKRLTEKPPEKPSEEPPEEPPPPAARRWPLASADAVVVGQAARIRGRRGLGWDLYKRLGVLSIGTLFLTGCIFFVIPRLGRTAWRGAMLVERKTVGFTEEVELGELGTTVENAEEVGRIRFVDETTGENVKPARGLYLHGIVLTTYKDGRWKEPYSWADTVRQMRVRLLPSLEGMTRQEIMLEPLDTKTVFHVRCAYIREGRPDVLEDVCREKLLRPVDVMKSRYEVALSTPSLVNGRQSPWTPEWIEFDPSGLLRMPGGSKGLPWLRETAERWLKESNIPRDDPVRVARFLEHKLRDTGVYKYSLTGQSRDPNVDPIEDFVANNRAGHCEYFATALALMLRSQGIPSRVIVGYLTEEWNEVGGFFQIRQLHAHTWVEARVPIKNVPEEVVAGRPEWEEMQNGWLRLDPTAGQGTDTVSVTEGVLAPVNSLLDRMEFLWDNYVMEMDQGRQSRAIYQPLREWASALFEHLRDPNWWAEIGRRLGENLNPANWNVEQWFSWRGGLVAVAVCFVLAAVYYVVRAFRRWMARTALRRRRARRAAAKAAQVEFYRRLEVLLAGRKLERDATMTHREFAARVDDSLAARTGFDNAGPLVHELTDAFYRVRFAHRRPRPEEQERIEEVLGELERILAPAKA